MLEAFGLSSYESRVFLELLRSGTLTARQVSNQSEVPYGRIYDVLNSLDSRGLIIKSGDRPQKFHAIEPENAIERLKTSKVRELDQLLNSAGEIQRELEKVYSGKDSDEILWKLGVAESTLPVYMNSIRETRKEYLGYVDLNGHEDNIDIILEESIQILTELKQKNVNLKMLIAVPSENFLDQFLRKYPNTIQLLKLSELRMTKTLAYPFSIIDGEKSLIKVRNPVDDKQDLAVLYVWQQQLARQLRNKFVEIWENSKPIEISAKLL